MKLNNIHQPFFFESMNKPAHHDGHFIEVYERLKTLIPIMMCKSLKGLIPTSLNKMNT